MRRTPIELIWEDIRSQRHLTTEDGYRFINNDIAMLNTIKPYRNNLPVVQEQPYRLREYRIARVLEGTGIYVINLTEYEAHKGDVILCLPNDIIELRYLSPDFDFQMIAPSEQIMLGLPSVHEIGLQQGICFHPEAHAWLHIEKYIELLWASLFHTPFDTHVIQHLLTSLLLTLKPMYEAQNLSRTSHRPHQEEIFRRFLALVSQHARAQRNIDFYADQLCLSPHYLSGLIRETSGQTVMTWINRSVILEAKVLLKHSNLLNYQIADELNFPNPSFFSKFFKRMTGMTPGEYRACQPEKAPVFSKVALDQGKQAL